MSKVIFFLLAAVVIINSGIENIFSEKQMRKEQLQRQRDEILGHKSNRVEQFANYERNLIRSTQTNITTYLMLMCASVGLGWLLGKLIFTDTFISLFLAVICVVLPHALLVIRRNNQIRTTADELENAMRIITHEYVSNLDIEKAVENSVNVIEHDKPFREFLVDMRMVSANVERNLRRLESKENNTFFSRWIDQLILTQSDRTQVVNLMPILQDMNDAKTTQRENDTKVAAAWQEYFTMLALILLSPLLIRIIQYEWYSYLVNTLVGKILIVAMLISLVWATGRALKINQPITG
jgi:hypothetical protein